MQTIISLTIAALLLGACGEDDPCQEAMSKLNACRTAADPSSSEFRYVGECNDKAQMTGPGGTAITVALKSWSEKYLDCELDPVSCECPTLGPWINYTP